MKTFIIIFGLIVAAYCLLSTVVQIVRFRKNRQYSTRRKVLSIFMNMVLFIWVIVDITNFIK